MDEPHFHTAHVMDLTHSHLEVPAPRGRDGQSKSHKTEFREPSHRTPVDGVWKSEYLYTFARLIPEIQAKWASYNIILPEVDKVIRYLN